MSPTEDMEDTGDPNFSNEFTALPATAPDDHMHIIDLDDYNRRGKSKMLTYLSIWDVVATVLYKFHRAR